MLNLDCKIVKENVLNNVLPYIERIETEEILMNIVTIDMAKDMNVPHKWINSILVGSGLVLIGTMPIMSLLGITGAVAIGLGIVNYFTCKREDKVFDILRTAIISYLFMQRDMNEDEIIEGIKDIHADDFIEFLENSAYFNIK